MIRGKQRPWSDAELQILKEEYPTLGVDAMMAKLQRTRDSIFNKAQQLKLKYTGPVFHVERAPEPPCVTELIERRIREFEEVKVIKDPRQRGIVIETQWRGPIALGFIGDPHLDDRGMDMASFRRDCDLLNSRPNILAGNIGDLVNNWIGSLARLHGEQNTTQDQALKLIEWMCGLVPWGWIILGNHDLWNEVVRHVAKTAAPTAAIVPHGAQFLIRGAGYEVRLEARHDHPGRSMYNAAHGQLRANYRGSPCHIHVGGHIHEGAYTLTRNAYSGVTGHSIRLGSYKVYDDYAEAKGYKGGGLAPSCLCVVDPTKDESDTGFINVFFDLEDGIHFLDKLQEKYDALNGDRLTG